MKKRAFTLIELLVVVAIIGILATVVIVNVSTARSKAIEAKVSAEISEANKAAMSCVAGGGRLISYPANNQMNGQAVCDNSDATDTVWPNLNNLGWTYSAFNPTSTTWTGTAQYVDDGNPRSITFTDTGTQAIVAGGGGGPVVAWSSTPSNSNVSIRYVVTSWTLTFPSATIDGSPTGGYIVSIPGCAADKFSTVNSSIILSTWCPPFFYNGQTYTVRLQAADSSRTGQGAGVTVSVTAQR